MRRVFGPIRAQAHMQSISRHEYQSWVNCSVWFVCGRVDFGALVTLVTPLFTILCWCARNRCNRYSLPATGLKRDSLPLKEILRAPRCPYTAVRAHTHRTSHRATQHANGSWVFAWRNREKKKNIDSKYIPSGFNRHCKKNYAVCAKSSFSTLCQLPRYWLLESSSRMHSQKWHEHGVVWCNISSFFFSFEKYLRWASNWNGTRYITLQSVTIFSVSFVSFPFCGSFHIRWMQFFFSSLSTLQMH